jgi:hypothetical protein
MRRRRAQKRLDCRRPFPGSITDSVSRSSHAPLLAALLVASCATVPEPARAPAPPPAAPPVAAVPAPVPEAPLAGPAPAPFSAGTLDMLPRGWKPYRLARFKKPTDYRLVPSEGTLVLQATADASASGIQHELNVDLHEYPWLTWRWKVPALNPKADNTIARVEDSPARVIVVFEGGRDRLPGAEQLNYDLAKAMTGNELPYATIMYIWENHLPEGAIIPHAYTTRIKMIVAGSGADRLGQWHEVRKNVLEDYRRAFGEEPPPVRAIGIMSDSDNTGEHTVAYYGDIRFQRR